LDLPQAKLMKISPKYGNARLRISTMGETSFLHCSPRISARRVGGGKVNSSVAPSIGHNHGLFDDL
jgi:hypothetical protein